MFGIGFEELLIIAVVVLVAVGPDRMPTFVRAVGKGIREFRRATRELKASVGLDELMRDEDLRELRNPLAISDRIALDARARRRAGLSDAELAREMPAQGVDLDYAVQPKGPTTPTANVEEPQGPAPAGPVVEDRSKGPA